MVPPLAAIVLAASGRLETAAIFTASISGLLLPAYAVLQASMDAQDPQGMGANVQRAYWFSVTLYTLLLPYLFHRWRLYREQLDTLARKQKL